MSDQARVAMVGEAGVTEPLGVGMDLAEQGAFSHLDDASIRRAGGRWLRPDERVWCAAQASFREAMVIVLSCKEAVYKAWVAPGGAHELSLTMHGCAVSGWAVKDGIPPEMVLASWEVSGGAILTFAVAAPAERGWHLLERILSERHSAPGVPRWSPSCFPALRTPAMALDRLP